MNSCLGGCFAIKNQKSSLLVRGQSYLPCQSSSCTLCRSRVVVYEAWTDPDLSKRSKHSSNSSNYSCYTNCGSNRLDDFEDHGNYWIDDDCESSIGSTAYGYSMPRIPLKKSSKVLDMLLKCFWKCTPGCQQISLN